MCIRDRDIALLYRSNFLSRRLEEELNSRSIPYKIFGGFRFFERAEVKDVIAYLRLSVNTSDDAAFERTVNNPPRGLGEKTIQVIRDYAKSNSLSMWDSINQIDKTGITSTRAINALNSFINIIFTIEFSSFNRKKNKSFFHIFAIKS